MRTAALAGVMVFAAACAARQGAEPQTGSASPLPPEAARATANAEGGAGVAAINSGIFRQAAGATAAPADLPLGPGDLLEISVVDMPEISGRRVRIPRQGTVNLPLLGDVMVAGRTSAEVEEDLRKRLQDKYMHDPQVAVFVHERRSQRVSVLGAVKKGGVFELSGRMRLADALAMAEGLTDDADQVIFLFRRAPSDVVARVAASRGIQGAAPAEGTSAQGAATR
ncbi:MAG TPA: polysaccharide biosynthesis/export family protein, partial [Methylomirabilota bacterium]|nr:polysaccharide biosynthesis/export family protein [Methylomirabilota bacterium]